MISLSMTCASWRRRKATGADVPVCLDPRPRIMRGIGDILSEVIDLPPLDAVLVNPGVALATKDVFAMLNVRHAPRPDEKSDIPELPDAGTVMNGAFEGGNDLEPPAIALHPAVADVLGALRATAGCRLARMSGSGATCFGLYDLGQASAAAATMLATAHPGWWVRSGIMNK